MQEDIYAELCGTECCPGQDSCGWEPLDSRTEQGPQVSSGGYTQVSSVQSRHGEAERALDSWSQAGLTPRLSSARHQLRAREPPAVSEPPVSHL